MGSFIKMESDMKVESSEVPYGRTLCHIDGDENYSFGDDRGFEMPTGPGCTGPSGGPCGGPRGPSGAGLAHSVSSANSSSTNQFQSTPYDSARYDASYDVPRYPGYRVDMSHITGNYQNNQNRAKPEQTGMYGQNETDHNQESQFDQEFHVGGIPPQLGIPPPI